MAMAARQREGHDDRHDDEPSRALRLGHREHVAAGASEGLAGLAAFDVVTRLALRATDDHGASFEGDLQRIPALVLEPGAQGHL